MFKFADNGKGSVVATGQLYISCESKSFNQLKGVNFVISSKIRYF